jgi:hypothetical protein
MTKFAKLLTATTLAISIGVAAVAASAPADANPRGIKSLSGMDLGSGR